MGTAAARNRDGPMCIPPSNNTNTNAMVITCSTVRSDGGRTAGTTCTATAAPTSTSSATGTFTRSVRRFANTATRPTALENKMISAYRAVSFTISVSAPFDRSTVVSQDIADQTSRHTATESSFSRGVAQVCLARKRFLPNQQCNALDVMGQWERIEHRDLLDGLAVG